MKLQSSYRQDLLDKIRELERSKYTKKNYKRLKVIAIMRSNPILNGYIYLDGILSFARLRSFLGDDYYSLPSRGKIYNFDLPLMKKNGSFLCSYAKYKKNEYVNKWRKRFDIKYALKYKDKKKVKINSGIYKNYNMPIIVNAIKKISWICIGDKEEIGNLLKKVIGIGKKRSQGYGIVDKWIIKETDKKGKRHFHSNKVEGGKEIFYIPVRPPYCTGSVYCKIDEF